MDEGQHYGTDFVSMPLRLGAFPAPILNLRQARVARNSPRAKGEIQEGRGDFPPNMRIAQNRDFSKSKGSRIGRASRKYRPSLRANDVISVP